LKKNFALEKKLFHFKKWSSCKISKNGVLFSKTIFSHI